jgi:SpoIID/LytB domain protein
MSSRHSFRPAHRATRLHRPWSPLVAAAVAALAAGPVLGSTGIANAAEGYPAPKSGSYTITGAGFGHGNGMSQYGAKGAATRGLTAQQITDFYYPGTAYTHYGDRTNRVRLSAVDARPVGITAQAGLTATDGTGKKWTLSPSNTTTWRFTWDAERKQFALQRLVSGAYKTAFYAPGPLRIGGPATITVQFGRAKTDCKRLSSVTFAGTLRALAVDGVQRSTADVSMEYFLRGVVPSESPASWPAAALQAQAVAARSYAAFKLTASRWFDSIDTTQDQCWDGAAAHQKTTDAAVKATAGKVRTYQGKPAFTQFSSSNGGHVNQGSQAYLKPKADSYEKYSGNPNASWKTTVSVDRFRAMAGLASVAGIRVTARDGRGQWGGRIRTLVVDGKTSTGKAASKTFTGQQVRINLGLKSTYFTLVSTTPAPPSPTKPSPVPTPPAKPTTVKNPYPATAPTLWRSSNRTWSVQGRAPVAQGTPGSRPFFVDLDGDRKLELANYDMNTNRFTVRGFGVFNWGSKGDVPIAGDFNGNGRTDLGIFRPSTGQWYIRGFNVVKLGQKGDIPLLRDFTGDGKADPVVFRPSNSTWYRYGAKPVAFGKRGDIPVPADYNGDGKTEMAVYTPSTGAWTVYGSAPVPWGKQGDIPVPGDYDGDGKAEMVRYRPSVAGWYPRGKPSFAWGTRGAGNTPVAPLR